MKTIYKLFWVIIFLIKNKGHFKINMQTDYFTNDYYIDNDNEDNYIKTNFIDLVDDIFNGIR